MADRRTDDIKDARRFALTQAVVFAGDTNIRTIILAASMFERYLYNGLVPTSDEMIALVAEVPDCPGGLT